MSLQNRTNKIVKIMYARDSRTCIQACTHDAHKRQSYMYTSLYIHKGESYMITSLYICCTYGTVVDVYKLVHTRHIRESRR